MAMQILLKCRLRTDRQDIRGKASRDHQPERASASAEVRAGQPAGYESEETTHFTVVDAAGNAVANTYTLNNSYDQQLWQRDGNNSE